MDGIKQLEDTVGIHLTDLGDDILEHVRALLSQQDALSTRATCTRFIDGFFPRDVKHRMEPGTYMQFLVAVARYPVETLELRVHPESWNEIAPVILKNSTFKKVALYPVRYNDYLPSSAIWFPRCEERVSGFAGNEHVSLEYDGDSVLSISVNDMDFKLPDVDPDLVVSVVYIHGVWCKNMWDIVSKHPLLRGFEFSGVTFHGDDLQDVLNALDFSRIRALRFDRCTFEEGCIPACFPCDVSLELETQYVQSSAILHIGF